MAKHVGEFETRDEAYLVGLRKSLMDDKRPQQGKHGVVAPVPSLHPLFRELLAESVVVGGRGSRGHE